MTTRSRREFRHVCLALLLTLLASGLVLYAVVKTKSVKKCFVEKKQDIETRRKNVEMERRFREGFGWNTDTGEDGLTERRTK